MNREFLMLAHTYKGQDVRGWLFSEKLDGTRIFWDGGATRGKPTPEVPWANLDKSFRPTATGLWSRYGNVVCAPDFWLDQLPQGITLDGEGFLGRGMFQECRSIMSKHTPIDHEWQRIKFMVFESPPPSSVFTDGRINNANYKKIINGSECMALMSEVRGDFGQAKITTILEFDSDLLIPVKQHRLPMTNVEEAINDLMMEILEQGGEGSILRNPDSMWWPKRTTHELKVKPFKDAECKVIGYTTGKIGKEGRVHGKLGALIVEWKGKKFKLSGMKMDQRELNDPQGWAYDNPDRVIMNPDIYAISFPVGSVLTFKYRELSDDGIPKDARYYRG